MIIRLLSLKPLPRLLLYHLLEVIDTLGAHVHRVFKRLIVLCEVAVKLSNSGTETRNETFEGFQGMVHVLHVAWQILGDELQRWKSIIDERIALNEFCTCERGQAIPERQQEIVALRELVDQTLLEVIILPPFALPCVLDLRHALVILLNGMRERSL